MNSEHSMTLPKRVCRTLEGIAGLGVVNVDDKDQCRKFVDLVYRFTHLTSSTCKNTHDDWMEEFERIEEDVERSYYTSPPERWLLS